MFHQHYHYQYSYQILRNLFFLRSSKLHNRYHQIVTKPTLKTEEVGVVLFQAVESVAPTAVEFNKRYLVLPIL
jgi:hypothetical protein